MSKPLDLSEKGRSRDGGRISLDSRLFVQFLGFGGLAGGAERKLIEDLSESSATEGVLYRDANDHSGVGLVTVSENPEFFVTDLREFLSGSSFAGLRPKPEYTMLGRTYSFGYEGDLEEALVSGPKNRIFDSSLEWAIWYPLRRAKAFETLPEEKRSAVLGEHGRIGRQFGKAGYAKDIRLASHGLDKNDNDFVIGLLGGSLHPLSAVVERMRKTEQTSEYIESMGPFFVGKKAFAVRGRLAETGGEGEFSLGEN